MTWRSILACLAVHVFCPPKFTISSPLSFTDPRALSSSYYSLFTPVDHIYQVSLHFLASRSHYFNLVSLFHSRNFSRDPLEYSSAPFSSLFISLTLLSFTLSHYSQTLHSHSPSLYQLQWVQNRNFPIHSLFSVST